MRVPARTGEACDGLSEAHMAAVCHPPRIRPSISYAADRTSSHEESAINLDDLSMNETRSVGAQKENGVCDLL